MEKKSFTTDATESMGLAGFMALKGAVVHRRISTAHFWSK
jgi:hypothetical protein